MYRPSPFLVTSPGAAKLQGVMTLDGRYGLVNKKSGAAY